MSWQTVPAVVHRQNEHSLYSHYIQLPVSGAIRLHFCQFWTSFAFRF